MQGEALLQPCFGKLGSQFTKENPVGSRKHPFETQHPPHSLSSRCNKKGGGARILFHLPRYVVNVPKLIWWMYPNTWVGLRWHSLPFYTQTGLDWLMNLFQYFVYFYYNFHSTGGDYCVTHTVLFPNTSSLSCASSRFCCLWQLLHFALW